jgi:hypothetical protein
MIRTLGHVRCIDASSRTLVGVAQREVSLDFTREWIEFFDPADADHQIRADLTWLCSRWTCIFGRGCHGTIQGQESTGCCNHGAYFSDKADEKRVKRFAAELTRDDWQLYDEGHRTAKDGTTKLVFTERAEEDGEKRMKTRVVDGACIFANREDHPGGIGCALHGLALRKGMEPLETKPEVCWQLPVRREQEWVERTDGTQILQSTLSEFDRRGWGEGGHDLDWYCTSSPEAHVGGVAMYVSYRPELIALIGEKAYDALAVICAKRLELGLVAVHPATAKAAKNQLSNL